MNPKIYIDGSKQWYCKDGICHRGDDKPAIIETEGAKVWVKNGKIHRDNNLPAVIYPNGTKSWYKEGRFIVKEEY